MKNNTNMGSLRSCLFVLVMFVQLQIIIGKPFLTDLLCDFFCDDDDDDVTTATSTSDEDDYSDPFGICSCGTRRPPRIRPGTNILPNINMRLPPSVNGMNLNITNNNGQWSFNLDSGPNSPPTGGLPSGSPVSGSPPSGVPPAPGASTTSPITAGGATTAAATAASTTAKK